jgi:hypothetical protein
MPKSPANKANSGIKPFPAPTSPEDAEKTCIALAMNLAMQRLQDGSATSQEVCYFLKLGSQKEKNENEYVRANIASEHVKAEQIQKAQNSGNTAEEALAAFRGYSMGLNDEDEYYD